MDHFTYKNGVLFAEDVPIASIASEVGTPFYCYSAATIERHYTVLADALSDLPATICYAVKANSNQAVIRTLATLGAGADVVSDGELIRALQAGIPAHKIVFSGVGKTEAELALALEKDILQINIESVPELERLDAVAKSLRKTAPVALRINPDIDAESHDKISTGRKEDKFGIEWPLVHEVFTRAAALENVQPVGLAVHIGSQLTALEPFKNAFLKLRDMVALLRAEGHEIQRLDVGGGLGIPYDGADVPSPAAYVRVVVDTLGDLECDLLFEPGRMIVGNAGLLVTKVVYIKEGAARNFVIIDAAMNDLMRPSLYGARHEIVPVTEAAESAEMTAVDVVGPVCETGDTFATELRMPPVGQDDLLALRSAGAYGAVMASTYNSRALVPEILVKGDQYAIVRERVDIDALLRHEKLPNWLSAAPKN
ncbi:MAG: diaminopimelate decarboxylase [Rhodospirillaceae bacterium TMED167]|nr:diaminopimelate decarboxylase [Rhodospirillaceae bacterium]OUW29009.1 MAG: diaminopimelate decarboxylase [Rhodospirillaceae bacterium TMED167]